MEETIKRNRHLPETDAERARRVELLRLAPSVVVADRAPQWRSAIACEIYATPWVNKGRLLWIFHGDIELGTASFLGFRRRGREYASIDHAMPLDKVIPVEWQSPWCDCPICTATRWWLEWRAP